MLPSPHARLASGWLAVLYREGVEPSGPRWKVSERYISSPFPEFILTLPCENPERTSAEGNRVLPALRVPSRLTTGRANIAQERKIVLRVLNAPASRSEERRVGKEVGC